LYEKVLDLREKRLDNEEFMAETQRSMDDLKKTMERQKQREKQIDKDSRQTEIEIQQFHSQKQASLNLIEIVVPLRISQLDCFTLSGKLSGPSDKSLSEVEEYDLSQIRQELMDAGSRQLIPQMTLRSHALFKTSALLRLQERIGELHNETEAARADLHQLYKRRVTLEKEREVQRVEIDRWLERINELQMLKFGRLVDLDDIEVGTDTTKDQETAEAIKKLEDSHLIAAGKLLRQKDQLKEEIAAATRRNTELLQQISGLTETKLAVTRELNSSADSPPQQDSLLNSCKENDEKRKIASYVKLQARQIESLKAEITILKRKAPINLSMGSDTFLPVPPPSINIMADVSRTAPTSATAAGLNGTQSSAAFASSALPPIPSRKNGTTGAHSHSAGASAQKRVEVNLQPKTGRY